LGGGNYLITVKMTQRDNILQELTGLNSMLVNLLPQNPYAVPGGYFDGLATTVLNRIKAMETGSAMEELSHLSSELSNASKQMPFAVPVGYFDGLAEKAILISKDYQNAGEELEAISPMLSGLKKQLPYSVPQGYFENLADKNTSEQYQPTAKVVSFTKRKWFRYAAAAVVVGIIATTAFLFLFPGANKEAGGQALAKFTRDIKKMDEKQKDNLIDFIDAGMSGKETAQVNTPENKSTEVKKLLQGISDEELNSLNEQTEDIQDILMTN